MLTNHQSAKLHPAGAHYFDVNFRSVKRKKYVSWKELGREPFRLFFPAAVLAGIIGVSLWPLHFCNMVQIYPNQTHPRIMVCGMFGAFIFGFLGTALPRMLSSKPFRTLETVALLFVHLAMVFSFAAGKVVLGDELFLALLFGFLSCVVVRARYRKDTPPPGFLLIGLALLCVTAGTIIGIVEHYREIDPAWDILQRLLSYQGFILLPILGIGPFLLPRFVGMPNRHDFPEMVIPSRDWWKKASGALATGALVIVSFIIEMKGWIRIAHAVRFATVLGYCYFEMPFHRAPGTKNALGASIRISFIGLLAGFAAVALFPGYRVGLLHLTLVGGFAVMAFVVATRVVFGHSGNNGLLKGRNRWLLVAIGIMLFGMATRISGDFWPKIMASHYIYGAIVWIVGVLLWSTYVLPKVILAAPED